MEATLSGFGMTHFGKAPLCHQGRNKRLVKVADSIMSHPGGTLPDKMGSTANLKALYRLVANKSVTHAAVMQTHRDLTRSRMLLYDAVVLLIHDTTQLDYTGKGSLKKIGQIAKGFHRGYLCHNTLALEAETGRVIGLSNQIFPAQWDPKLGIHVT